MTDTIDALPEPPVGHVKVVYLGPVAPHWDFMSDFGDSGHIEQFKARVEARLLLLPPHDPQFRRNRERVNRDAERENLLIDWDLGYDEEEEESEGDGVRRQVDAQAARHGFGIHRPRGVDKRTAQHDLRIHRH